MDSPIQCNRPPRSPITKKNRIFFPTDLFRASYFFHFYPIPNLPDIVAPINSISFLGVGNSKFCCHLFLWDGIQNVLCFAFQIARFGWYCNLNPTKPSQNTIIKRFITTRYVWSITRNFLIVSQIYTKFRGWLQGDFWVNGYTNIGS